MLNSESCSSFLYAIITVPFFLFPLPVGWSSNGSVSNRKLLNQPILIAQVVAVRSAVSVGDVSRPLAQFCCSLILALNTGVSEACILYKWDNICRKRTPPHVLNLTVTWQEGSRCSHIMYIEMGMYMEMLSYCKSYLSLLCSTVHIFLGNVAICAHWYL